MEDNNKVEKQDDSSHHHHHSLLQNSTIKEDQYPRNNKGNIAGDRLKRDEWSEGAVSTLLEAYEAKWVLRNRAKLKGHDWEDVAKYVSNRANSTKSPKTQTQCKNKIESMKKRYRSESATTADASSWPLYSRLDVLLRGTGPISVLPPPTITATPTIAIAPSQSPHGGANSSQGMVLLEPPSVAVSQAVLPHQPLLPSVAPPPPATAQNSHGSDDVEKLAKEDGLGAKSCEHVSNKNPMDSDSSTPALYSEKGKVRCSKRKMKSESNKNKLRRNNEEMEIGESIRWLAEVVARSEQTRMDTMKEIERMRVEAEAKRGEIELKRTEIIANTQLEIARIFACFNKGVDSSLRIGRS